MKTKYENITIQEDGISAVLWQRWIACYMLYDWNLPHADSAYVSNKSEWVQEARRRVKAENETNSRKSIETRITEAFNRVLAEAIEEFIQKHIEKMKCDRTAVELHIAWVISDIFTVKPQETPQEQ